MQIKRKKEFGKDGDKPFFGSLLVSKIWVVERQFQPLVSKTPDFVGCDLLTRTEEEKNGTHQAPSDSHRRRGETG